VRDIELRLISELMKNSRRSDRQLAKAIGTSQPTVSRMIKNLEKEGCIREYTVILSYAKLGFQIMALTFFKLKRDVPDAEMDRIRKMGTAMTQDSALEVVMTERGMGMESSVVAVSFHKDYSAYKSFREWISQFDFIEVENVRSFLIDLNDEVRYRPLTFSTLARRLAKSASSQKTEVRREPINAK
jgi:DNA-binding Lrp family transcriptional regulator